jgi:hypothetical protein
MFGVFRLLPNCSDGGAENAAVLNQCVIVRWPPDKIGLPVRFGRIAWLKVPEVLLAEYIQTCCPD